MKLARLARLKLSESEAAEFQKEISEILRYIEQLQQADIRGLKPTTQVTGLTNIMREDEVVDYGVSAEDLLREVPHKQNGHIKVRRMIG